jgi:hypothetical protein
MYTLSAVRPKVARCKLPFALRPDIPRVIERTKRSTKEITMKHKGKSTERRPQSSYRSSAEVMKEGVERKSGRYSSSAPSSSASCNLSASLSLRSRSPTPMPRPVRPQPGMVPSPHARGGEEGQNRRAASRIGEEVPDFKPVLAPPGLLPHLAGALDLTLS